MQVSCLWLHPVAVIWFARIHRSGSTQPIRAKQSVWRVSVTLMPGAPPPPQAQWLLLPGQLCSSSSSNCKQWRSTDNNNRTENCPTIDQSKRRNKASSVKRKSWTEPERKQDKYLSIISEVEGAVGFVSERCRVGYVSGGQVRTPAWYLFNSIY